MEKNLCDESVKTNLQNNLKSEPKSTYAEGLPSSIDRGTMIQNLVFSSHLLGMWGRAKQRRTMKSQKTYLGYQSIESSTFPYS